MQQRCRTSSYIDCVLPKIESRLCNPRLSFIVKCRSGPKIGFAEFTMRLNIGSFGNHSRSEWASDPSRWLNMGDQATAPIDGNRPATLHSGAVSTDFPSLREAIFACNRLRPEQARKASIRVIGGPLLTASEIAKLEVILGLKRGLHS